MTEQLTCPCPYMVRESWHYTECALQPASKMIDPITHKKVGPKFCLCAWFWDISSPTYYSEISVDKNGKPCIISDNNFPDIPREPEPDINDVPKWCPKGYTWEQIDKKMKALEPDFFKKGKVS